MRDSWRLPADIEIFFLFKHAHHRLTMTVARRVEETTGVPAAQVSAVIHLDLMGPSLVGELGDRLGLNSAGTTGLVSRLEQRGLIQRERCPQDRRATRLQLTGQGRDVAAQARPIVAECAKRLTEGLSTTEAALVTRFLTGVAEAFVSTPTTDSTAHPGHEEHPA
jgi:DNA-binding MarR family transcriptional regulator